MLINRSINRDTFTDAYGVHVKDSYELVKMAKKPIHNNLGEVKKNERIISYDSSLNKFCGVSNRFSSILLDMNQLQPLMDQLVNSEKPYDKERFKNIKMDMSPENYEMWFKNHNKNCKDLIYLDDSLKNIIGFARMSESDEENRKYVYICNFVVDNRYRGKGIGKYMLQRLENYAYNTKCNYIILSCYRVNKAIKLYKSLGFKELKGYNELWEQ